MSNNFNNNIGPNVGYGGSYVQLGAYNSGVKGIHSPVPLTSALTSANGVNGYYVVPAYSAPGYDTLTRAANNSSGGGGYFRIGQAYGSDCNTEYISSLCQDV